MIEADYYIEDVFTRVPGDVKLLKSRIRECRVDGERKPRIADAASFMWTDDEFRARFRHVLKIQPLNTRLCIEGVLSYEDIKSASRTPLWGSISFYSTARLLDRAFDSECNLKADELLKRIAASIRAINRRSLSPPAVLPKLPTSYDRPGIS